MRTGAAGVQREQRAVHLHREILASTEGAAHAGQVDAHLLGRQAEAGGDLVAIDVQPLRRDIDVHAALAVGHRETGLGSEEGLILDAHLVGAAHDHLALGRRVAVPDHDGTHDVRARVVAVAVPHGRALGVERGHLGGASHVVDRRQRLVLDDDRAHGLPGVLERLRGDDRHRLAGVADAIDRQHRLVGELEAVGLGARYVRMREHRVHAGQCDRPGDVDRHDAGVRVRAAQRRAVQHARHVEIARVRELARHLGDAVGPLDGLADAAAHEGRAHACSSAEAARTAARMRP